MCLRRERQRAHGQAQRPGRGLHHRIEPVQPKPARQRKPNPSRRAESQPQKARTDLHRRNRQTPQQQLAGRGQRVGVGPGSGSGQVTGPALRATCFCVGDGRWRTSIGPALNPENRQPRLTTRARHGVPESGACKISLVAKN